MTPSAGPDGMRDQPRTGLGPHRWRLPLRSSTPECSRSPSDGSGHADDWKSFTSAPLPQGGVVPAPTDQLLKTGAALLEERRRGLGLLEALPGPEDPAPSGGGRRDRAPPWDRRGLGPPRRAAACNPFRAPPGA